MENISDKKEKIINVLLFFNLIFLITNIFYVSKPLAICFSLINITFLGSYLIIKKYSNFFGILSKTNKIANKLNDSLANYN